MAMKVYFEQDNSEIQMKYNDDFVFEKQQSITQIKTNSFKTKTCHHWPPPTLTTMTLLIPRGRCQQWQMLPTLSKKNKERRPPPSAASAPEDKDAAPPSSTASTVENLDAAPPPSTESAPDDIDAATPSPPAPTPEGFFAPANNPYPRPPVFVTASVPPEPSLAAFYTPIQAPNRTTTPAYARSPAPATLPPPASTPATALTPATFKIFLSNPNKATASRVTFDSFVKSDDKPSPVAAAYHTSFVSEGDCCIYSYCLR